MEVVLATHTHLGIQSRHAEDAGQDVRQVGRELAFHEETDSLPRRQQVDSLRVLCLQLRILDMQHGLDYFVCLSEESLLTNTSANNSYGLNNLAAELLVFFGLVVTKALI